jgi:hypothetical protein
VTSSASRRREASVTASTARSNASWLALDGRVDPLIFRTYCRAAASISSGVAGGEKLWRVRMFRHIGRLLTSR